MMSLLPNSVELIDADDAQAHPGRPMSEEEFVDWCQEKTRAEWADGKVIIMPAVTIQHARWNLWLASILNQFAIRYFTTAV